MGSSNGGFGALFERTRSERRLALLPWVMAGYPSPDATVELVHAMAEAGGDGFEISVPFSDPMADGPTVQRANQAALAGGMTPRGAIDLVARIRKVTDKPLALMGYMNPIARFGLEAYCRAASSAGADALIVPDLPPEEGAELGAGAQGCGLDLVQFVAPTTTAERVKTVARAARGFIYCVGVVGVTGARSALDASLEETLGRVRAVTTTPVVVGFGISKREHLEWLTGRADGAIVASALVDRIDQNPGDPRKVASDFVGELLGR